MQYLLSCYCRFFPWEEFYLVEKEQEKLQERERHDEVQTEEVLEEKFTFKRKMNIMTPLVVRLKT